jgi:hypothetical protein
MNDNCIPHLRNLAGKYAEYATSKIMEQRREKWRLHNRMENRTVPFHIEDNGTYHQDLCPPLKCSDPDCRALEARLLNALISYEKIDDDRIVPDRFVVDWVTTLTELCPELAKTHATDSHGRTLGYKSNKPIKDIDGDFHKLSHRSPALDASHTEKRADLATEVFRGLLPVEVGRTSTLYSNGITNKAVHLMGMQELYMEMAVDPDAVHRLLSFIADDNYALGGWEEDKDLLTNNNDGNQGYCSGSSQYSDEVSSRNELNGEPFGSEKRFGYLEAQEAVGISPDMFAEFLLPHFLKVATKFKLMKFGCCEPVHDLMPHLHRLHGLRKVSVTPWCNLEKLATVCNRDIIWSRKPVPLKLVGDVFDPDEFRSHIEETLEIGKDYFVELIFRDTCRLTGDMEKRIAQACDIVREITDGQAGSKNQRSA